MMLSMLLSLCLCFGVSIKAGSQKVKTKPGNKVRRQAYYYRKNTKRVLSAFGAPAGAPRTKQDRLNQSPINLSPSFALHTNLKDIEFNYDNYSSFVLNVSGKHLKSKGRFVAMNSLGNNFIVVDGLRYRLEKIAFKVPSEHVFDWQYYDAELQFVHKTSQDKYVVLAVMLKKNDVYPSKRHLQLQKLIDAMYGGRPRVDGVEVLKLLPQRRHFYRYTGSLTEKPFTQQVTWHIFSQPILISLKQFLEIKKTIGGKNNRAVQLPDNRSVFSDTATDR